MKATLSSLKSLAVTAWLVSVLPPVNAYANPGAIPHLDHVFLIMMENQTYQTILGSRDAPFINRLARTSALASNYFAVGHPSLTNYLEVVGGSNFGIQNDNFPNWHHATPDSSLNDPISGSGIDARTPAGIGPYNSEVPAARFTAQTIADQLAAAGKSWKSYQESLPASGLVDGVNYSDGADSNLDHPEKSAGDVQQLYAVKHNPFVYFANIQQNKDARNGLHNIADFSGSNGLYADLNAGKAPNLSFIVPNQCHDMHGISNGSPACTKNSPSLLQMGDAAVNRLVAAIKASPSWNTGNNVIVLLWDENDYSSDPNQVILIVDSNFGAKGFTSDRPYSHFSLLKTLQAGFGLPCLNHACDSSVNLMSDLFRASPSITHTK